VSERRSRTHGKHELADEGRRFPNRTRRTHCSPNLHRRRRPEFFRSLGAESTVSVTQLCLYHCKAQGGQARAAPSIPNLGYAHCPARPPLIAVGARARVPRKPARARTSFPPTSGQTARQWGGEATVWNPASGDRLVHYIATVSARKATEGHSRAERKVFTTE
jgi:hypothetical protein